MPRSAPDAVIIERGDYHNVLCRRCAVDLIDEIDYRITLGMRRASVDNDPACADCHLPYNRYDDPPTLIRIGAWRRHLFCAECSPTVHLEKTWASRARSGIRNVRVS
jgi:hypothetical protein